LSLPKINGLHHVAVHVNDLEESRSFYENIFGFISTNTPEAALE
jgi:catechol 2,3-dioxygenase-like lactoylglutathione lyase family enzyme